MAICELTDISQICFGYVQRTFSVKFVVSEFANIFASTMSIGQLTIPVEFIIQPLAFIIKIIFEVQAAVAWLWTLAMLTNIFILLLIVADAYAFAVELSIFEAPFISISSVCKFTEAVELIVFYGA